MFSPNKTFDCENCDNCEYCIGLKNVKNATNLYVIHNVFIPVIKTINQIKLWRTMNFINKYAANQRDVTRMIVKIYGTRFDPVLVCKDSKECEEYMQKYTTSKRLDHSTITKIRISSFERPIEIKEDVNINCIDCVDCVGCVGCIGCIGCVGCENCINLQYCHNSKYTFRFVDSKNKEWIQTRFAEFDYDDIMNDEILKYEENVLYNHTSRWCNWEQYSKDVTKFMNTKRDYPDLEFGSVYSINAYNKLHKLGQNNFTTKNLMFDNTNMTPVTTIVKEKKQGRTTNTQKEVDITSIYSYSFFKTIGNYAIFASDFTIDFENCNVNIANSIYELIIMFENAEKCQKYFDTKNIGKIEGYYHSYIERVESNKCMFEDIGSLFNEEEFINNLFEQENEDIKCNLINYLIYCNVNDFDIPEINIESILDLMQIPIIKQFVPVVRNFKTTYEKLINEKDKDVDLISLVE